MRVLVCTKCHLDLTRPLSQTDGVLIYDKIHDRFADMDNDCFGESAIQAGTVSRVEYERYDAHGRQSPAIEIWLNPIDLLPHVGNTEDYLKTLGGDDLTFGPNTACSCGNTIGGHHLDTFHGTYFSHLKTELFGWTSSRTREHET